MTDVAAFENVAASEDGVAVVVEASLRNVVAFGIAPDASEPGAPFAGESTVAAGEVVACAADVAMFGDELVAAVAFADVESVAFAAYVGVAVVTVVEPAVEFAAVVVGRFVETEDSVGSSVVVVDAVFEVVGDVAVGPAVGAESGFAAAQVAGAESEFAAVQAVDVESDLAVAQAADVESDLAAVQAVDVSEAVVAVVRSEVEPVAEAGLVVLAAFGVVAFEVVEAAVDSVVAAAVEHLPVYFGEHFAEAILATDLLVVVVVVVVASVVAAVAFLVVSRLAVTSSEPLELAATGFLALMGLES